MALDDLLENLGNAYTKPAFSSNELAQAIEKVLDWLVRNNTDENCCKVDTFVTLILDDSNIERIPGGLYEILFDMGGALYNAHTHPQIAINFSSTPELLLERIRKFKK